MTLREFFKRWSIATTTWIRLKKIWNVKNKRDSGGKVETANPGGPALKASRTFIESERDEYLILKGYQMAVRELLNIGRYVSNNQK